MLDIGLKRLAHPPRLVIADGVSGAFQPLLDRPEDDDDDDDDDDDKLSIAGDGSKFGNELARTPS